MTSTGIVRKVDELGRVVLPIELRRALDIAERDSLEVFVENDMIVLKKHHQSCIFCNGIKNITSFKGKSVCSSCISSLTDIH